MFAPWPQVAVFDAKVSWALLIVALVHNLYA
jgi:hypothetical protein